MEYRGIGDPHYRRSACIWEILKNGLNQPKLKFHWVWWTRYSLPSFWAKLGYSQIKIDWKLISLYSLHSKIGVHLLNGELTQLFTPLRLYLISKVLSYGEACFLWPLQGTWMLKLDHKILKNHVKNKKNCKYKKWLITTRWIGPFFFKNQFVWNIL